MKNISEFKVDLSRCTEICDLEKMREEKEKIRVSGQFAQLVLKGLFADIENAEKYFRGTKLDQHGNGYHLGKKRVNVDGTSELQLWSVDNAEEVVARFPLLKVAGLYEDWDDYQVDTYYSESGYGFFTDKSSTLIEFDPKSDGGDGRWAYECDMTTNYEIDYEDIQCGIRNKSEYHFSFNYDWQVKPLVIRQQDKHYSFLPECLIEDTNVGEIPEGVTEFSFLTITNYKSLRELVVPKSVKRLEVHHGYCCYDTTVEKIILEDQDGEYIFENGALINKKTKTLMHYYDRSATEYTVSDLVTKIDNFAFHNSVLKKIVLHDKITEIQVSAFEGCAKLENVNIPSKVKKLDFKIFKKCTALKEIEIPDTVETIRSDAFALCKEITIVASAGGVAYQFAKNKKINVRVKGGEEKNTTQGGGFFGKTFVLTGFDDKTERFLTKQIQDVGGIVKSSVVLDTSVLIINPNYNGQTTKLMRAKELNERGKDIKIITDKEFCLALEGNLDLGLSVEGDLPIPEKEKISGDVSCERNIKEKEFEKNLDITSVEIKGTVKRIGCLAFRGCKNLTKVILNEGIEQIDEGAFMGTSIKEVEIPSSVKIIGDKAFADCKKLTKLKLNEGLEEIGAWAFRKTAIENVIIPNSVKRLASVIGKGIFQECSRLKSAVLPNETKEFPHYMFADCKSFEAVTVPMSITAFGTKVISGNSNAVTITYPGTRKEFESIKFWGFPAYEWSFFYSVGGPCVVKCKDQEVNYDSL
ncbi:MAG: leucine-rich repeat protein [Clostridia bacterium]|nr:leucine-rich repeat protein [Clostridia bacterium]